MSNPQYRKQFDQLQKIDDDNLIQLEKLMMEQFKFLLSYVPTLQLKRDILSQVQLALLHFYYSIKSEDSFPFMMKKQIFDWKMFERENNVENARRQLDTLF